jgi:DNA-binding transcriptional LysR family regulator
MTYNWNDIEVFCTVATLGSFTRAAERLDMPKSSTSRAVANLESRLGLRLLERSTRRLRLTAAGQELSEQMAPLFARLEDIIDASQSQRHQPQGVLRISTPFEFGVLQLNQVICALLKEHAGLEAEIEMSTRSDHPIESNFDLVFSLQDQDPESSSLVARRVFSVDTVLCAAPELVAQLGQPRHPKDLATWPCLCEDDNTVWRFTSPDSPELYEVPVRGRLRTSNASLRLGAAEAGLGATIISTTLCRESLEQGRLQAMLPHYRTMPRRIYAFMPSRKHLPPRVRTFLDALASYGESPQAQGAPISPLRYGTSKPIR